MNEADAAETKAELLRHARALGIDACRIAQCTPPRHRDFFGDWLARGLAAEMDWMKRGAEKRGDPQQVLPGARSMIVVGCNYFQGTTNPRRERGRIARYAWGDDYHDVILPKLRALDSFLQTRGGTQKCYVDTGPILERDFAAEAGVGWHGKSTMLVDGQLGVWFFLGEILTTLDLAADTPQPARCGSCTRCIDVCPTHAIVAPQQLDARRCISYLTIELKGAIPLEFRRLIGDRIYGCDACLEVCPWNRFAKASRETAFELRPAFAEMRLRDFLELNDEEFRALFRGSPIKRIKRRGFLRNVCVALGNVGDESDLPALQKAAQDPEPLIAEHAAWAIAEIRDRLQLADNHPAQEALCLN